MRVVTGSLEFEKGHRAVQVGHLQENALIVSPLPCVPGRSVQSCASRGLG